MRCKICKDNKVENLKAVSGYYYCSSCHTAWLKKIPKSVYEEDYYMPKSGLAAKLFAPIANLFYKIRQNYTNIKSPKIWLDVGAGKGEFLQTLNVQKRIGVEISKTGRKMMKKENIETMTPQRFLKARGLKASVISFWHVLEHLENPWDYLSAAQKNLSTGGEIIIGVPNIESWDFKLFTKDWFHLVPQYHLWHYSPKSVAIMLESSGLKIKRIDYWSVEHHLPGILQSFINKSSGSHNVLHKLIKRETDLLSFDHKVLFWIIFWLTIGSPIVIVLWIINSLFKRSGTIIITAKKV